MRGESLTWKIVFLELDNGSNSSRSTLRWILPLRRFVRINEARRPDYYRAVVVQYTQPGVGMSCSIRDLIFPELMFEICSYFAKKAQNMARTCKYNLEHMN